MVELELREVQINQDSSRQVIVLAEKDGERAFPIYIGSAEVLALDNALHRREAQRPMTHDLICNIIDGMGGDLDGIEIDELKDDTFYGKLLVRAADGSQVRVDTRPSDAVVLAIKRNVPIYASEAVLDAVTGRGDEEEE